MSAHPNLGMQPTTFDNPMGIDGFEFVEYTAPQAQLGHLHDYFKKLGFVQVAQHKTRPIHTYRQGDCTFLINEDPDSFAARFAAEHGLHFRLLLPPQERAPIWPRVGPTTCIASARCSRARKGHR